MRDQKYNMDLKNNLNSRIILRIAEIRKEKNISQSAVSRYLHLSSNGYSRIENGHTQLTINTLHAICNYLNIELGTILDPNPSTINIAEEIKCISVKKNGNSIDISIDKKLFDKL